MILTRRLDGGSPDDRERGSGTLEYVGVLGVAAVLIGAVVISTTSIPVQGYVSTWSCRIMEAFGQGGGGCGAMTTADRAPEDWIPPDQCVIEADGSGWTGSIAAGVQADAGGDWLLEQLDDGTYRITAGVDAGLGAEVGIGFDVSWRDSERQYGLAASAGAAASVAGGSAEVYIASTLEEADRILNAKKSDTTKAAFVGDDNPVRDFVDWISGRAPEEDLAPVETVHSVGLQADLSANVLLGVAPAEASVTGGIYGGWIERADGTRTDVWTASSEGNAMAAFPIGTDRYDPESMDDYAVGTASYAGSASFEVDRDADGTPVAIRTTTVGMKHSYGGEISERPIHPQEFSETRVEMPLETRADRELAARIANGLGIRVEGINDSPDGWTPVGDTFRLGDSFTAMSDAAKERGYYWVQDYTMETLVDRGGNFDAAYILKAGLSGSYYEVERIGTGYRYWNGNEFVSRSGCH